MNNYKKDIELSEYEKEQILIHYGMSLETIDAIIGIYGTTSETYENMLYYLTGYQTFDQIDY